MIYYTVQSSLKYTMNMRAMRGVADSVFGGEPHSVGFTEVAGKRLLPMLRLAARDHDYVICGEGGDTCIAVRNDLKVINEGVILVNPAQSSAKGRMGHSKRVISWARFQVNGNVITDHEAHWLNRDPVGHLKMTEAMVDAVGDAAKGRGLAFFKGDINIPEEFDRGKDHKKPDWLFGRGGLETIWDELNVIKPTHNKFTIDIVGSFVGDGRVKGKKVRVIPGRVKDHDDVHVWYEIA